MIALILFVKQYIPPHKLREDRCYLFGAWVTTKKARCKVSFFRGAGWVEMLRFLTRNVYEPRHAKLVSEHAKHITPWGFLEWHCYVAAGRKLLEIAF